MHFFVISNQQASKKAILWLVDPPDVKHALSQSVTNSYFIAFLKRVVAQAFLSLLPFFQKPICINRGFGDHQLGSILGIFCKFLALT